MSWHCTCSSENSLPQSSCSPVADTQPSHHYTSDSPASPGSPPGRIPSAAWSLRTHNHIIISASFLQVCKSHWKELSLCVCMSEKEHHRQVGRIMQWMNLFYLCFFSFCPPTCPPGVLIIWLGLDVGFEFFLLVANIHPPVPHYLLLGAIQRTHATTNQRGVKAITGKRLNKERKHGIHNDMSHLTSSLGGWNQETSHWKLHMNVPQINRCCDLSQTGYTDSVRLHKPVTTSQDVAKQEAAQTASAAVSHTNFEGGASETVARLSHTSSLFSYRASVMWSSSRRKQFWSSFPKSNNKSSHSGN